MGKTGRMNTAFHSRPYQNGDIERIHGVIKLRPASRVLDYPAPADIDELLALPHIQSAARVWETEDGIFAGYAFLNHGSDYAFLSFEAMPAFMDSGLEEEMLTWGETFFCQVYPGAAAELATNAVAAQPERIALLEQHGYQRDPESVFYFLRPLDQPIPVAQLPEGFTIRPLKGEEEVSAWVKLHQAAFDTQNMTVEYRRAMMSVPAYIPELDLVAVTADGRLAAYVFGSIHAEENELTGEAIGWTDPISTHPAYQRMGLSHALLLESLRRLKALGMQSARLGTSSENTAMQHAAQSAGYELAGQAFHYLKKLRG
jgi:ribosomal protein S18 acetylase RimI-like enzyme